ncbi:MAG: ABC transporter substrate-binding protein [Acetivibrionales bacterium]|jgi:NitT/TauT family transport system substrate-binding protein
MKKNSRIKMLISALLVTILLITAITGCGNSNTPAPSGSQNTPDTTSGATLEGSPDSKQPEASETGYEPADINMGGMTGPTSMGMVKIMEAAEAGTARNNYNFTVVGSADEITPKLLKGELDIAAVPANLASVLYNNTGKKVKLLAVNTLGVLYIVEKGNEIESFTDLKGKTIYATGRGSTPEYTLRYLLSEHGIDPDKDVDIQWKSEPNEVVALLKNAETGIAMMPQPYVTIAQTQVEGLRTAADLTKVWDELDNGSALITGVVVVRSDFAEQYPRQLAAFLDEYWESAGFVNANVEEAAQLIEKFNIFKAAVAQKAIPYCNITFMEGEEMKRAIEGYLKVLFDQNPKSVGGAIPEDDFYYIR